MKLDFYSLFFYNLLISSSSKFSILLSINKLIFDVLIISFAFKLFIELKLFNQ